MLASRPAAFVCLTLVSLVAAKCKKISTPPQPGFLDKTFTFLDSNPRYNLYLYKGDDCTGEALKHKWKDGDSKCINLPKGWNDKVRSIEGGLADYIQMTMYKDADCKNEYGVRVGPFFIPDMQKGKTCDAFEVYPEGDFLSLKQRTGDIRKMSSYRMDWRVPPTNFYGDIIYDEVTYCVDHLATL
ncbi:hypothetical protein BJ138DRAFT_397597 [Hygrophoropsis aurantiaca]|uniref:Uncharacterized protein n=1 Tax=Hygrophoropsis aurantiaca TaxID=72124 RepID=A0ACB8A4Y6_9AGAM|nr:hypothetical protein BJ138DRAFT_397597 [Hygrophoropsis aurantiaca]